MNNLLTYISLYCGAVGTYYLNKLNFKGLLAIDYNPHVQTVFENNYKEERYVPFQLRDLKQLTATDIMRMAYINASELFLFIATPPCPGFSISGLKDAFSDLNAHFLYTLHLIKETEPKFFIIENVRGMVMEHSSLIFNEIKYRISELENYEVEARVVNSLY